jgi:phosphoglycolate phosphatase-like HAD superfamily hydrolase
MGRPYPFMIQKMMQEAGITDAQAVIKVGDTSVDINEGRHAGCKYSIGITTGAFTRAELELFHPSFIIDHLQELETIIQPLL